MSIRMTATSNIPLYLKMLEESILEEQKATAVEAEQYAYDTCRVDTGYLRSTLHEETQLVEHLVLTDIEFTADYATFVERRFHTLYNTFMQYEDEFRNAVQRAIDKTKI
jgi:hypothetical protein